jgi:DNA-binding transcriptional regulator YhcF (GntR family)
MDLTAVVPEGTPDSEEVTMAPSHHGGTLQKDSVERVRQRLLTALHFGRLTPGDRAPSVRRLAELIGLNRKTVHRAYARLAEEGMIDLRPGSGTFISETLEPDSALITDLLNAAESCGATARSLGLPPDRFTAFLEIFLGQGYRTAPLVVTECNREQLGLIALELTRSLGLRVEPALLSGLRRCANLHPGHGILTTDCHHAEVVEMTADIGAPVYRVALDPVFPREMIAHARRGPVVMVVTDATFAPVFRRLLRAMSIPEEIVRQFRIIVPADLNGSGLETGEVAAVHISPLVDGRSIVLRGACRILRSPWRIEPGSLERLKVSLSLNLSSDRPGRSSAGYRLPPTRRP